MTTTAAPSRPDVGTRPTLISRDAGYVTVINFLHVDESNQSAFVDLAREAAHRMEDAPGNIALDVLRSLDGSRVMTYAQWINRAASLVAEEKSGFVLDVEARSMLENDAIPRLYTVVYTDDRSAEGISVISPSYAGAIFVNEITTRPDTQHRLLELVIANNESQSQHTPGYRSANFHRSLDGRRAVNYSLWDTQEHCIEAISAMADMDLNLDETVEIANPDFRFYELVQATPV